MTDCLFCKIANGSIPVSKVFEDDQAVGIPDINPQAPTHILIIPRKHVDSLAEIGQNAGDETLLGHLLALVGQIASAQGLTNGYRTVINTGPDGGQTVNHLHLHLLGKRALQWPPG